MAANFEGNRWYTSDNMVIATFTGWVAIIQPTFVGNSLILRWSLILSEGDGGECLPPAYYSTLEEAITTINNLSDIKLFQDLKNCILAN